MQKHLLIHLDIFKMKKLFNFILLFSVIYSKANLLAQGEQFTEFDIYELKISDKETAYSPTVLKVGESQIELIIVTSQKNENINKIKRKFKDVEVDKIFNLQKITIDNKPPFEIISKVSLPSTINTSYQEGPGIYSPRTKKLYFTRSSKKISKNKRLHLHIYESSNIDGNFQSPKKLEIFNDDVSVMHPSLDSGGDRIYFAANIDQADGYDLFSSKIDKNGVLEQPQKLENVNSSSNEAFPFIFKDLLFFASNRGGGIGGFDIYFSKKIDGEYQKPSLLPRPINSEYDDFSFSLQDSLKYGFFTSNKEKDSLDISYLIEFKPLKGNTDTYKYASFKPNLYEDKSVLENDSIQNNVIPFFNSLVTTLVEKPEKGELILSKDGKFTYNSNDPKTVKDKFTYRISDGFRESKPIKVELVKLETEIPLRPIYYDFAKFNLIKQYKPRLDSIATLLKTDLSFSLLISSYTDARGSFENNKKLSENRSKTIFKYLSQTMKIDPERLSIKDYGEQHIKGNFYKDYLVEALKGSDEKDIKSKLSEYAEYNPFVYKNSSNTFSLIVGQFDFKKQGLRFIKKLKKKNIYSSLILNRFINVSESEHQKNRKTEFEITYRGN